MTKVDQKLAMLPIFHALRIFPQQGLMIRVMQRVFFLDSTEENHSGGGNHGDVSALMISL